MNHGVNIQINSPATFGASRLNKNREEILDQNQQVMIVKDSNNTPNNTIINNRRLVEAVTEEPTLTISNITNDIEANLGSIVGYTEESLLPLVKACTPLTSIIPNLSYYVELALNETPEQPPDGLTIDESAAIRLYTIEWTENQRSLYSMLNYTLKKDTRENLRPYFKYLKLFLTALAKLPCAPSSTIWRGVPMDLSAQFPLGTSVIWWAFSSCTTSLAVLENNMYLGDADEILLLPGTKMIVQSQLSPAPDLHIIHLKQIRPKEMLLEPPFKGWLNTGSMNSPRTIHTQSVLLNGKVLVTGGNDSNSIVNSAELYDPSTRTWTTTGSMNNTRQSHTASLLTNGKILVTGGYNGDGLNSAELYDPSTGTWTMTSSMINARMDHTASVLKNGAVLITGGYYYGPQSSCELYDPLTGTWTTISSMNHARFWHTASVLQNGAVLVTGGLDNGNPVNSAELYDPSTGTWTIVGSMNNIRYSHTASVLLNGQVLVNGGHNGNFSVNSAELYDPSTKTWKTTDSMINARAFHKASVLTNGIVIVTGGFASSCYLNSAELYKPSTGTWTTAGSMNNARYRHESSVLNGNVLVTGGLRRDLTGDASINVVLNNVELYILS
ncbi:unnamed protein product [Rotaria sordida]|uniref:Uncharacterized protein n=1 Tax=Rotaria sordida TaxID=392033 RepID=A0A815AM71_9BILA|nr:unnamed protein product [Rotaria sordida]CAF1257625.1 unnamed protein product [Rotaria sordida]